MKIIDAEKLRQILRYDPVTGQFTWIEPPRNKPQLQNQRAGAPNSEGYIQIIVDGVNYKAHRLAWLYMTGEWPLSRIDHENRVKVDNSWPNLRLATHSQNIANSKLRSDNVTGVKGVARHQSGKFVAYVYKDKKRFHLGSFETVEAAAAARFRAATVLHGEFATV